MLNYSISGDARRYCMETLFIWLFVLASSCALGVVSFSFFRFVHFFAPLIYLFFLTLFIWMMFMNANIGDSYAGLLYI